MLRRHGGSTKSWLPHRSLGSKGGVKCLKSSLGSLRDFESSWLLTRDSCSGLGSAARCAGWRQNAVRDLGILATGDLGYPLTDIPLLPCYNAAFS